MVVRPGFVHTAMTAGMKPAPLAVGPERVAADIVRGLERGSELVWSPPTMRPLMSVMRHIPRAVFRRLPI
jgi:decaprenylphospho-beta-D-erythro-pentofuranosid-2-ulose 2-reductase